MALLVTQTALLSGRGKTYTASTASTTQYQRHAVHNHSTSPLVRRGSGTSALSSQLSQSQQTNHRRPSTTTHTSTASRSSGLSDATAAVLAQSQAALREAERIDAKYAHLAAELNIQLPKHTTTRESTRDRQSRRPMLDMDRRTLPDIASIPTSNRYAAVAAGIEEQTTDNTDVWVEIASSYATEDKSVSRKLKTTRSRTNSTETTSTQATSASSSSSSRQELRKALREAQAKSAAVDARIAEEAIARALEKERDLEDQALKKINKPNNQTFFEQKVAPVLQSKSLSSNIIPQPAKGALANRNPRQILPSRGWEFAPQIQGRPKREARRQAANSTEPSITTESRNDLPSVSLPPRPSAPTPPSTKSASTIEKSCSDSPSVSLPPRPSAPVPPSTRSASTISTTHSKTSVKTASTISNASASTTSTSKVSDSTDDRSLSAKGASATRKPPPILPSRGMEVPSQIEGPPKRRARQALTDGEWSISRSRDNSPSVSLPPRPSALVPPSSRSASTCSTSSSLSFGSVLSGTSMGGRSERSVASSTSTKSGKTSSNSSTSTRSTSRAWSSRESKSLPAAARQDPPPILPSRGWEVPPQIEGPPKRRARQALNDTGSSTNSNWNKIESSSETSSPSSTESSSSSCQLREMNRMLATIREQYAENEADIGDGAIAKAQAEERELEDQALRKIEKPSYQTFFEHQVAPHLRSESPSFGGVIFLQPANGDPINRNPRQILPSRGWEFTPHLQGPPKKGARQQAATATESSTRSKSRNDRPSVSLPPRPSAPVPPSTRKTLTSSTNSSLSFASVIEGTSYGGRSERASTSRSSSSSTVNSRDETISELVIPRKRARQTTSTSTESANPAVPEARTAATTTTRERSRTTSASSRVTSASSLPEEHMSAISVPRQAYRQSSLSSSANSSSTLPEENMSAISVPRHAYRTSSSSSRVSSRSALPEEKMSFVSVPRRSYQTSSSTSRASSKSILPEEQMSAISIPRQSYRTISSSSSATSTSTLRDEQMSAVSIPRQAYRTVSSRSSASRSSTLSAEGMSMISVPRQTSQTTSSSSSVTSTSTLPEEGMSAISVPRQSYRTASSSSSGSTRSRRRNWVEAAMRMIEEED